MLTSRFYIFIIEEVNISVKNKMETALCTEDRSKLHAPKERERKKRGMIGYVVIAFAIVILLIIKLENDKVKSKKKLVTRLKKKWGEVPEEEYTSEKFQSITAYYNDIKNPDTDIDDITWNDLDMDQIYMTMNNTVTAIGEEYLYALLRQPKYDENELKERNRLIEFFSANAEKRLQIQEILSSMGKVRKISIYEYMNRLHSMPKENNMTHYLLILSLFISVAFIFFDPLVGIFLTAGCVVNNIIRYYKRKMEIEKYYEVVSYIIRLLDSVKTFNQLDIDEIKEYTLKLKNTEKIFASFRRGATIVSAKKPTGDMLEMVREYPRMIFHMDLIKFNKMIATFENNQQELREVYDTVGFIDSMIAAASFRTLMEEYCLPELTKTDKPYLEAVDAYHPMLNHPVKNSIKSNGCVLITGSNASGKSTFIKTLAINAILSQTIYTAMCSKYKASYFKVASSMALQDSIFSNESYYIVEIKSLKRIIDMINDEIPTLCFVDEVLRGTNTLERIAASSRILHSFAKMNAMCFAATHDIELTHILEKFYTNYHFQEQIADNNILFDYILYSGRAISKNAIKLLSMIGYSDEIINEATESANQFLETGEWDVIQ